MALRFPHLLITATFGSLSAHLSLRADAAEIRIGKFVIAAPFPRVEHEAARPAGKTRPAKKAA
jgi:hypothetical protein